MAKEKMTTLKEFNEEMEEIKHSISTLLGSESFRLKRERLYATSKIVTSIIRGLGEPTIRNLEQNKVQNLIRTVYMALDGRTADDKDRLF